MIPKGLFTQIAIIALAVGVVLTYVMPQFEYISSTQDLIVVYQKEREKVVSVNSQLSQLVTDMEEISIDDRRRLVTYLPNQVDSIAVQRDIKNIIEQSGAIYRTVTYNEGSARTQNRNKDEQATDFEVTTQPHSFSVAVEGTYNQLKNLLSLLERNNYPLQIQSASLQSLQGGFMSMQLEITTYALENAAGSDEVEF